MALHPVDPNPGSPTLKEPLPHLTITLMTLFTAMLITCGAMLERRKVWSHIAWSFLWFPAGAMCPLSNPLQQCKVKNIPGRLFCTCTCSLSSCCESKDAVMCPPQTYSLPDLHLPFSVLTPC